MADALTDDQVKDELNPDEFEMMFLQTAEGKAPEVPAEPVTPEPPVVEPPVVEPPVVEPPVVTPPVAPEPPKVEPPVVTPPAAPAAPEPPAPAPVIEYTAEELADLESVKKDFPEVTKALAAQERLLTEKFGALLQTEVAKVQQTLAPVYASAAQSTQAQFKQAIAAVHADAETLLPDAEAWITTQPKFLQDAYNRVLDNGTVAEVVEFFTTFKTATGRTETPAAGKTPEELAAEATIAAEKAKKLASQEGVKNVRTPSRKDNGPLDFETAFNQVA